MVMTGLQSDREDGCNDGVWKGPGPGAVTLKTGIMKLAAQSCVHALRAAVGILLYECDGRALRKCGVLDALHGWSLQKTPGITTPMGPDEETELLSSLARGPLR